MRLSGWHVDAFGALTDVGVRDLPGGLVVFHGPNAAGKSTLLAFLQRTLFGHPHRNVRDVNHYEPLAGSRRGGRVFVTPSTGVAPAHDGRPAGDTVIERRDGAPVRVVTPDGRAGGPDELDRLTGGADERLFNAVFAFDLDDLRSIDSLGDDAVRDRLFSAGVRGAGRSARAVVERLEQQAGELWTPRSRTAPLDRVEEELREVGTQLDRARQVAAAHPERLAHERRCRAELERLDVRLGEMEETERRAETLLAAWPAWQRRRACARELAGLGEAVELDEEVLERHERLRTAAEAATDRLVHAEAEQDRLAAQRDGLRVDPCLAEVADEVLALDEERTAQLERLDRLTALEAERDQLGREHARSLAALGPGWDDGRVARLDASIELRGTLRDWQGRLERAERHQEEAERGVRAMRLELRRAEVRAAPGGAAGDGSEVWPGTGAAEPWSSRLPSQEELDAERAGLVAARAALADLDAAERALVVAPTRGRDDTAGRAATARLSMTDPRTWPAATTGLVAGVAALAGLGAALTGRPGVATVLVLAALALGGLAVVRVRARAGTPAAPADAPARVRHLGAVLTRRAELVGLPPRPGFEDIEARLADLDAVQARRRQVDQQAEGRAQAETRLREAERDLAGAEQARDEAARDLTRLREAWADWCHGHELDPTLDPATVIDVVGEAERARDRRLRLTGLDEELTALHARVDAVAARAERVLATVGHRAEAGHRTPARGDVDAVRGLATAVAADRARRAEHDRLHQRVLELDDERRTHAEQRDRRLAEREALLRSAGAADEAELRRVVARSRRRRRLCEQLRQADLDLGDRLGEGPAADALRARLAAGDRDAWETELEHARRQRSQLRADRDAALEGLLEARRQREEVETSELVADLDRRRQGLLTRRDELVHEWRVARLAGRLVASTLEGYEHERQPAVLRRAGEHLAHVTRGELCGLHQQAEQLLVLDAEQRTCTVDVLSRGTAEQLYLCLRLALAEDLAQRAEPLPFVMDDVLVNFDPVRCERLATLLAEVATGAQLLYFTCHPHTVELLRGAGAAAVYDLPADGGAPVRRSG